MIKEKTSEDKKIPTAIKLINDALVKAGLESEFDVKLKSLMILIVDKCLKMGYEDGYKKATTEKARKIFDDLESYPLNLKLNDSPLYKQIKEQHLE